MWNQIFLLTLLQLSYASTRSIEPIEGPLWIDRLGRLSDVISDSELKEQIRHVEDDESDVPYYDHFRESDINIKEKRTFLSSLKSSSEKRALSMFARWGPINTIGKERNPIRSGYPPRSFDMISAQTRGRMLGQPLRWG